MNDRTPTEGRSERPASHSESSAELRGRLRPFLFLLARGDELLEVTFYAASEPRAVEDVTRWAAKRGWAVEGDA